MTVQEAIDLLDNLKGMIEDNHNSDYDSAFKMAIEALEKQIPKKSKESILGVYCSQCKHFLDGTEYHCQFCGQKLDWGDYK